LGHFDGILSSPLFKETTYPQFKHLEGLTNKNENYTSF